MQKQLQLIFTKLHLGCTVAYCLEWISFHECKFKFYSTRWGFAFVIAKCLGENFSKHNVVTRGSIYRQYYKIYFKICLKIVIRPKLRCSKIIIRHVLREFTKFVLDEHKICHKTARFCLYDYRDIYSKWTLTTRNVKSRDVRQAENQKNQNQRHQ